MTIEQQQRCRVLTARALAILDGQDCELHDILHELYLVLSLSRATRDEQHQGEQAHDREGALG